MSDRQALATAIEDAGIDRGKADRIASVIFDAIRENTATKADASAQEELKSEVSDLYEGVHQAHAGHGELRSDFAGLRADMQTSGANLRADFAQFRGDVQEFTAGLRGDFAELRGDFAELKSVVHSDLARMDVGSELRSSVQQVENRLLVRLGGGLGVAMLTLIGLLFAALQHWPPHG